jgi:ABC-type Zn uptake system ZnuABC Zn-binding protein ZnuA
MPQRPTPATICPAWLNTQTGTPSTETWADEDAGFVSSRPTVKVAAVAATRKTRMMPQRAMNLTGHLPVLFSHLDVPGAGAVAFPCRAKYRGILMDFKPALRRIAFVVLALLLAPARSALAAPPLRVLASFLPVYLFTANVAADVPDVRVDMMLPASLGCPHDYALTPADVKKIAAADLLVVNGLGMEDFIGIPVRKANPRIRIVESGAGVEPIRADSHEGHGHGDVNPHSWVSPKNAILQVRAIEKALAAASPANAARFRRNADAYVRRLDAVRREFEAAAPAFRNRNIVTFHNVFDYLARDLGLNVVGEIETVPGQEPSAGEIRRLVGIIRTRRAAAIFGEPQYPAKLAEMIGRETGLPVRTLDPVATGSTALANYEDAMRGNLRVLRQALGR